MRAHLPLLVLLLGVLTACGDEDGSQATAYGPLFVTAEQAEHPGAGAAGDLVDCRTWGDGGFEDAEVYAEGATSRSPDAALDTARSEGGFGGVQHGLEEAARTEDRVLYVVEVAGVVKQAVVVHDGEGTEGAGGDGWYVESWAVCDASELPASYAESVGLGVWTDAEGLPVPTTRVASWRGTEHCGWDAMTFLVVGERTYVRRPLPELARSVVGAYAAGVEVPTEAEATGWRRAGDRLWLTDETAYVGSRGDAEAWPLALPTLSCA